MLNGDGKHQTLEPSPEIQVGSFVIQGPKKGVVIIENESGEIVEVPEENFEEKLYELFKEFC
jgi:hypothetical protein